MSKSKKTPNVCEEKSRTRGPAAPVEEAAGNKKYLLGGLAFTFLVVAFLLYSQTLEGPFLFDDIALPFYQPSFPHETISAWLAGVRPMLMLSYWINFQVSARDPWSYHALNVILHAVNAFLVFVLLRRILLLQAIEARKAVYCAIIASSVFLIHPLQTEAVAYIAGRSELVCGVFALAALVVYSNPKLEAVTWRTAVSVLLLYVCAVLSKEQAVALPAVILTIDMVFRRKPLREALTWGKRLYGTLAVAGVAAIAGVVALLARSATAGFNVAGMQWYEYLFTQFRVWALYLGLAALPFRQNADYDIPLSRSISEHGAWLALAGLLVAALIAWSLRKRFPLLFGGFLIFAILLAPTSSFIPIADLAAERRLYIPIVGLLLAVTQALINSRWSVKVTAALATYLFVCSVLTYDRTKVWASDIAFWSDTTVRSPGKPRGYTHLTYAYIRSRRCGDAVQTALRAPEKVRNTPEFLGMLGHAYACDQRMPEAVEAFERAVLAGPSVGQMLALATTYRQAGRVGDAQAVEEQALKIPARTPYDSYMLDAFRNAQEQGTRSRSAIQPQPPVRNGPS
jgi:protein O-mannosyl-transferase